MWACMRQFNIWSWWVKPKVQTLESLKAPLPPHPPKKQKNIDEVLHNYPPNYPLLFLELKNVSDLSDLSELSDPYSRF